MKLTEKHKEEIKEIFLQIKSINDLLELLNHILLVENSNPKRNYQPIEKKHLTFILYSKKKKYEIFNIPKKKKGEFRTIKASSGWLKLIQRKLNFCLQLVFQPRIAAHGFVKDRSIVTNASKHVGKRYLYNIDLSNFFDSINYGRVKAVLKLKPFNFKEDVAKVLANIFCHEGSLPQGAPTSPCITNIVCQRLDSLLVKLSKKYNVQYTRYADDLSFSCNRNVFILEKFQIELKEILARENFKLNPDKTRLQTYKERQIVTGLRVNKKVNVSKKYISDLRFLLKIWELYGEEDAEKKLNEIYPKRIKYGGKVPSLYNVLWGKLQFLKMVKGKRNSTYKSLEQKFLKCTGQWIDVEEITKLKGQIKQIEIKFNNSKIIKDRDNLLIIFKKKLDYLRLILNEKKDEEYESLKQVFERLVEQESSDNPKIISEKLVLANPNLKTIFSSVSYATLSFSCEHLPMNVTSFFNRFHSTSSSTFYKLVHNSDSNLDEILPLAMKEFNLITSQERIPKDIFIRTSDFLYELKKANESLKKTLRKEIKLSDIYSENPQLIYDYKKTFWFGVGKDRISFKDAIMFHVLNINGFTQKYWRLVFTPSTDLNDFFTIPTNTTNILKVIENIFTNCEKYSNGIGEIKIEVKNIQNKTILSIQDTGSKILNKLPENIKGGDFNIIVEKLWSLCDFNIISEFKNNQNAFIPLLPKGKEVKPHMEKVEGLTYQFIFHQQPKVLLIDDKKNRLEKHFTQDLMRRRPDLESYISSKEVLKDYDSLRYYKALLVHASYAKEEGFQVLKEKAINEYKLKVIAFSGEKNFYSGDENYLEINDSEFYSNLELFLEKIRMSNTIDLYLFKNSSKKIENKKYLVEDIINKIRLEELDVTKLPEDIEILIKELLSPGTILPKIQTLRGLAKFLNHKVKKQENE